MIGGSILVTSRLQAVVLRMVDFGGVTSHTHTHTHTHTHIYIYIYGMDHEKTKKLTKKA
ncbi:hypothetical protein HanPI659440_Chr06g0243091 [Helianthus annuus]|nr:hypothetical protein HanPI659440_Chr06g0243091 [Helianthus annuus]